jgi:hypothetical protein
MNDTSYRSEQRLNQSHLGDILKMSLHPSGIRIISSSFQNVCRQIPAIAHHISAIEA